MAGEVLFLKAFIQYSPIHEYHEGTPELQRSDPSAANLHQSCPQPLKAKLHIKGKVIKFSPNTKNSLQLSLTFFSQDGLKVIEVGNILSK